VHSFLNRELVSHHTPLGADEIPDKISVQVYEGLVIIGSQKYGRYNDVVIFYTVVRDIERTFLLRCIIIFQYTG